MKKIWLGLILTTSLSMPLPARAADNTTLGVGTGAVAGALVGAFVTWLVAQRGLRAANVLAERTRWRERVRALAAEIARDPGASGRRGRLWVQLALETNPLDPADLALVRLARRVGRQPAIAEHDREELVERFALLLKHDWERAKAEASWRPWRGAPPAPPVREYLTFVAEAQVEAGRRSLQSLPFYFL